MQGKYVLHDCVGVIIVSSECVGFLFSFKKLARRLRSCGLHVKLLGFIKQRLKVCSMRRGIL